MPGPVSRTDTKNEPLFASALMATSPVSVNLMALPTRLIRTWVKRRLTAAGRQLGGHLDLEGELFVGRQRLKCAAHRLGNVLNGVIREFEDELTGLIFDRSSTSLMSPSRCLPLPSRRLRMPSIFSDGSP